jgi:hypothetical protein
LIPHRSIARIGILLWVGIAFQGCDPGYWVGVRANLKEPISPECIEHTLRKLPEIDRVTIYESQPRDAWYLPQASRVEQSPNQYMFEAGQEKGLITQFQKQEGATSFLAGVNGLGMTPPQDKIDTMQLFNARIAIQVARACNARYLDDGRFMCLPDTVRCREALQKSQASK